jgi:hypothetical protein
MDQQRKERSGCCGHCLQTAPLLLSLHPWLQAKRLYRLLSYLLLQLPRLRLHLYLHLFLHPSPYRLALRPLCLRLL